MTLLEHSQQGSVQSSTCSGHQALELLQLSSPVNPSSQSYSLNEDDGIDRLIYPVCEKFLSSDHYQQLQKVYLELYPHLEVSFLPRSFVYSKRAAIGNELFTSSSLN